MCPFGEVGHATPRSGHIHVQRRISRSLFAGGLALAVFVVGHNLFFLLRYGSGYASDIARTGDGSSWNSTVWFVLAAAALLATVAILRLGLLLQQVQKRSDLRQPLAGLSGTTYTRSVGLIWLKLLSASISLFVLQENLERLSAGLPLPWMTVIGTIELKSPILVYALVSLAFALVVALFRLGIDRLEALIALARTRTWTHATTIHRTSLWGESAPASVMGRNLAGRAPPQLLPA